MKRNLGINNIYWNVYLNLEKELLDISDVILIVDNQLDVYSIKIADLLVRTCVEIEAISKELYFVNSGPKNRDKKPYFDTDCIDYLNNKWKICKKKVYISCASFYLSNRNMLELQPLDNGNNSGDKAPEWMKAYQAVKHDRANNLEKGNLRNLIQAMAALYLLNLYMNNQSIELQKDAKGKNVDWGLGSRIFYVKCHSGGEKIGIDYNYYKNPDFDECVYLSKQTDKSIEAVQEQIGNVSKELGKRVETVLLKRIQKGEYDFLENLKENVKQAIIEEKRFLFDSKSKQQRRDLLYAFMGVEYEAVLNKNQL